jgi:hypothetical protein
VSGRAAPVAWEASTRTFRALDLVFDIRTTDPELARFLDHAFGTLPEADPADPARVRFGLAAVRETDGVTRHRLYRRGRVVARYDDPGEALPRLFSLINAGVRAAGRHRLFLHTSLVGDAHRSTLLVGESHAGKTTLGAVLVAGGASYGTDEMIGLDPSTGAMDCFRRPLTIRPASHALLGDGLEPPPWPLGRYFSRTLPIAATDLGATIPDPPPRVSAVVFPEYRPGSVSEWEPLVRAATLARLQQESWHLLRHGRRAFRLLVDLVVGAEACGVLRYPDAREAATLLGREGIISTRVGR